MLTDTARYRRAVDEITAKSKLSQHIEMRELWATIASSYVFLLEREERLRAEEEQRNKQTSACNIT